MTTPRTGYAVFSVRQLKHMLQVAEILSKKCGASGSDADCGIYGFEVLEGGQLALESVRSAGGSKHFLPSNNLDGELTPYTGEHTTYTPPPTLAASPACHMVG